MGARDFVVRGPRTALFGRGSLEALGKLVREHGIRALLCTDAQIAATPILHRAIASLAESSVGVSVFDGAVPDLPVGVLDEALAFAVRSRPDLVIGIGGGSSVDLAKLVALLLRHPGPVDRYYGENRVPGPIIPVFAVPTTAGTGSEVTPVAVVSDPARSLKVGVASPYLVPLASICDPSLTDGCPTVVTAHAGIDALGHAIEAFTARRRSSEPLAELAFSRVFIGKNAVSDVYALEAIRHIGQSLAASVANGTDQDARDGMAYGSFLAGWAFATAGTAAAHALQYPLGARTSTPHGLGIGLFLPYVMEYNLPARIEEYAAVGRALDPDLNALSSQVAAYRSVEEVVRLCNAIGIPATLADLGVDREDLPLMASQAATVTRLVENNPRPLDQRGLLSILEAAWSGDRSSLSHSRPD